MAFVSYDRWGIGLATHYFTAYGNLGEKQRAEREY
jgi:hypothetical protein